MAFAGRTDAGVHARGQVASFLTRRPYEADVFVRGLNHWLPDDIAVRRAAEVPLDFDVRRRARRRLYRYLIYNDPVPSPLLRGRAWHVAEPLDVGAMARAAACLVGRHDFAAFAEKLANPRASTVRTVYRFELRRRGRLLVLLMEAGVLPAPSGAAHGRAAGGGGPGAADAGRVRGDAAGGAPGSGRPGGSAAGALPDAGNLYRFEPGRRD